MIDWTRVGRAVYRVRQHYRYTYTGPVWDLTQRLLMVPRDRHRDQLLLAWDLDVRGTEGDHRVAWERDGFGNRVARVFAGRVPVAIDFEATFRVERRRTDTAAPVPAPWAGREEMARYLEPTALTAPDARIERAARGIADETRDRRERALLAFEWATRAIKYEYGVTGYTTPAAMALHLGRGVCQDYAHLLLAALRLLGVPCQYVSGHLLGEGAPHAWIEAFLPLADDQRLVEVMAYDPTHGRLTRLDYVTVAVGRDFGDVSPTSGVYSGRATGRLAASKKAEVVEQEPVEAVA
ncbi:MAG TPA: transglutaminase family protein [Candidatus Limnocylindria bacterium]|nr:transglutaminase family protein [Candidatus Limnocylindria bacterium]